jgi:hypothetical protein
MQEFAPDRQIGRLPLEGKGTIDDPGGRHGAQERDQARAIKPKTALEQVQHGCIDDETGTAGEAEKQELAQRRGVHAIILEKRSLNAVPVIKVGAAGCNVAVHRRKCGARTGSGPRFVVADMARRPPPTATDPMQNPDPFRPGREA